MGSAHSPFLLLQLWKQLPSPPQILFPAFLKHTGLKSFILGVSWPDKLGTEIGKCLNIHTQQEKKRGMTKNSRCDFDDWQVRREMQCKGMQFGEQCHLKYIIALCDTVQRSSSLSSQCLMHWHNCRHRHGSSKDAGFKLKKPSSDQSMLPCCSLISGSQRPIWTMGKERNQFKVATSSTSYSQQNQLLLYKT